MIKKNILAISLLGIFGLSHAADVENLRIISYLNEPLRLQADVIGEGEIKLAAPTEYLRLNHPIPSYDLSVDIVENNGQKQLVLVTTEEIESPALTLLLESRDANNRRQLFELPILLDFKPEPQTTTDSVTIDSEIVVDGETVDTTVATANEQPEDSTPSVKEEVVKDAETKVELADIPKVNETKVAKPVEQTAVEETPAKADVTKEKSTAKSPVKPAQNNALIKKYGPVTAGETLWSIANKVRPSNVTPQKMIEIIKANNPSAFTAKGVLRANVTLTIPTGTEPVAHKFVKPTDTERVGYIYELPEPPVVENAVETNTATEEEHVPVKVIHPVNSNNVADNQEFSTLAPDTNLPADSIEITEPDGTVENINVPVDVNQASVPETHQQTSDAVNNVPPVEGQTVQETVEETVIVDKVEPPKQRPVYVISEPEPEPSIIDLIFENIMYVGAAILVLILAVLAIVMRQRKKDDAPKKKAEKPKKGFGLAAKKGAVEKDSNESEEQPQQPEPASGHKVAPIVAASAAAVATAAVVSNNEKTETSADSEEITTLNFDLSFSDSESSITEQNDGAESNENDASVLDFTLSSSQPEIVEEAIADQTVELEEDTEDYGGLDFDLSFKNEVSNVTNDSPATNEDIGDAFNSLDFDLSSFTDSSVEVVPAPVEEVSHDIGTVLDFDFTVEDADDSESSAAFISEIEEPIDKDISVTDVTETLDFDLAKDDVLEQGFGENNPLFARSEGAGHAVEPEDNQDELTIAEEYISFPDLLTDAETALDKDVLDADKPADFGSFIEDQEAELANLIEVSKQDDQGVHPRIDLSFVADTDDHESGLAFLDTLDISDEVRLDDPIDNSVKDNVAKSSVNSTVSEPEPELLDAIEFPVIQEMDFSEDAPVIELLDFSELSDNEVAIESHVVEEPEHIELLDIPELNMVDEVPLHDVDTKAAVESKHVFKDSSIEDLYYEPTIIEEGISLNVPEATVEEIEPILIEEPVLAAPAFDHSVDESDFESEQVKLELALAYMDFDKALAKPLLDEVIHDGSPEQVAFAKDLLTQID